MRACWSTSRRHQTNIAKDCSREKGIIIHRDLKPPNVALTTDGQVKVDQGISQYISNVQAIPLSHFPCVAALSSALAPERMLWSA